MKYITRTVWILGLVSLLTDTASEMLYPVLPLYLTSIGFSVVIIGILEGFAEATVGLSKGYFGKQSDITGKRVPFVQLGYGLSVIAKPLMILFSNVAWVFFTRTLDRFGKGIRTGARDAMLSDNATPQTKGRVFGFHRAMDTLGAVIGPAIALVYLYFNPGEYKTLFLITIIPGVLSLGFTFLLKDKKKERTTKSKSGSFFSFLHYWKESPKQFRKVVTGLIIFALFNSSDVFLLLRAKDAGLDDSKVIGVFILYNLVYAVLAYPLGVLADRIGLKKTFMFGLGMFAVMYFGMSFDATLPVYIGLFACYGVYAAATDGIAKAWISNVASKGDTATAIGLYSGFQSIALMLASSIMGLVWYGFGPAYAFVLSGFVAVVMIFYFLRMKEEKI